MNLHLLFLVISIFGGQTFFFGGAGKESVSQAPALIYFAITALSILTLRGTISHAIVKYIILGALESSGSSSQLRKPALTPALTNTKLRPKLSAR